MDRTTRNRIVTFLIITLLLMYVSHALIWVLMTYASVEFDTTPIRILGIIGGGAPAFAALFLVYRMYSKEEQESYWERVFSIRAGVGWWLLVLLGPAIFAIAQKLGLHGLSWRPELASADVLRYPAVFAGMIFAGGAEELGWRGTLLDEARHSRYSLTAIALATGLVWAVWHAPLFLIDEFAHASYAFVPYLLSTLVLSLFMTALVVRTRSIGLAVLMHASVNAAGSLGIGPAFTHAPGVYIALAVFLIAGLVFVRRCENSSSAP